VLFTCDVIEVWRRVLDDEATGRRSVIHVSGTYCKTSLQLSSLSWTGMRHLETVQCDLLKHEQSVRQQKKAWVMSAQMTGLVVPQTGDEAFSSSALWVTQH